MTVNLGEHFEKMLADLIAGGRFQNQSEVIRAGLRLLENREYGHDENLEAKLLERLNSPSSAWTKADLAEIRDHDPAPIDWSIRTGNSGSHTATPSVSAGRRSAGIVSTARSLPARNRVVPTMPRSPAR